MSSSAVDTHAGAPEPELSLWERRSFREVGRVEVYAEHPRAPLHESGFVSLRFHQPDGEYAVDGLDAIFGDLSTLATRAGRHEETQVSIEEAATAGVTVILGVMIATLEGEDLRDAYFHTALWVVGPDYAHPKRLWAGASGESHMYFDACAFGVDVDFHVQADGTIARACHRVVRRGPSAGQFKACAQVPEMPCVDGVVADLPQ